MVLQKKKLLYSPLICMFQACEHLMLNTFRRMSETMCRSLIIKTGIDDDHRDCRECVVHPTSSMLTRHKAQPAQRQNEEVEKKTSRIVAQLMNYSEIILAVRYLPSSRILVIQLKRLVYKSL